METTSRQAACKRRIGISRARRRNRTLDSKPRPRKAESPFAECLPLVTRGDAVAGRRWLKRRGVPMLPWRFRPEFPSMTAALSAQAPSAFSHPRAPWAVCLDVLYLACLAGLLLTLGCLAVFW